MALRKPFNLGNFGPELVAAMEAKGMAPGAQAPFHISVDLWQASGPAQHSGPYVAATQPTRKAAATVLCTDRADADKIFDAIAGLPGVVVSWDED